MNQKKVTRSYCDHCNREFKTPKPCVKHEVNCFKNPDRTPFLGELTSVSALGRIVNFGTEPFGDNGPPGMDWFEFVEQEEMPKWWPGEGKIWTENGWRDVPFYESRQITGAHGCAGGAGSKDAWPLAVRDFGPPEPLNKIKPARYRLGYLDKLVAAPPAAASAPQERSAKDPF